MFASSRHNMVAGQDMLQEGSSVLAVRSGTSRRNHLPVKQWMYRPPTLMSDTFAEQFTHGHEDVDCLGITSFSQNYVPTATFSTPIQPSANQSMALHGKRDAFSMPKAMQSMTGHSKGYGLKLLVVVDTNVFIIDPEFLIAFKRSQIPGYTNVVFVIPWIVHQELDRLKDRKASLNPGLKGQAVRAVNLIHEWLETPGSLVICQNSAQAEQTLPELRIERTDDRILQCAIQFSRFSPDNRIILLTNDVNLRNKAIVLDINARSPQAMFMEILAAAPLGSFLRTAASRMNTEQHNILRVIVDYTLYPITIDTLCMMFSNYGNVLRIVTFVRNNSFHALVEFSDPASAQTAKLSLNGQNIYNGCCSLHIVYSEKKHLYVKYNNNKSRDFTKTHLSSSNASHSRCLGFHTGSVGPTGRAHPGVLEPYPGAVGLSMRGMDSGNNSFFDCYPGVPAMEDMDQMQCLKPPMAACMGRMMPGQHQSVRQPHSDGSRSSLFHLTY